MKIWKTLAVGISSVILFLSCTTLAMTPQAYVIPTTPEECAPINMEFVNELNAGHVEGMESWKETKRVWDGACNMIIMYLNQENGECGSLLWVPMKANTNEWYYLPYAALECRQAETMINELGTVHTPQEGQTNVERDNTSAIPAS